MIRGNVDCWDNERIYPTYDILASYTNHDICAEACNNNPTCIGFSVRYDKCTYKSDKCENVILGMTSASIWLKKDIKSFQRINVTNEKFIFQNVSLKGLCVFTMHEVPLVIFTNIDL